MSFYYKIQIKKTLAVNHVPFNDELVAYRCELTDEQDSANKQVWEGITEKDNLPSQENQMPSTRYGCVLKKDAIEKARIYGWSSFSGNFEMTDNISDQPFTNLDNENYERILLKHDCHMLFDASGKVLPVAKHLDYMSGYINNSKYDLKIALEHLKKHPHVRFKNDTDEILDIPYYNAEKHKSKYLDFMWTPDQETYARAWDLCKKSKVKYPSTYIVEAMYDLDLLGLTECGADLYPGNYYKSKEDEPAEDENDDWN